MLLLHLVIGEDGLQLLGRDRLRPLYGLHRTVLVLGGEERDDVGENPAESFHNLRLLVHLCIDVVGKLIVHHMIPLKNLPLLVGLLEITAQALRLVLQNCVLFSDAFEVLQRAAGELHCCCCWTTTGVSCVR